MSRHSPLYDPSMKPWTRVAALAVLVAAALSGCGAAEDEDDAGYGTFADALEAGASCSELFEIRNSWDPKSPHIDQANIALREIGCYTSSSTRTD